MGFNPFKKVKDAVEQTGDTVGQTVNDVTGQARSTVGGGLDEARNAALGQLDQVRDDALSQIQKMADHITSEASNKMEKAANDAKSSIESHVPETLEKMADELEKAAKSAIEAVIMELQSGVLNKVVDVIQVGLPNSARLKLGPLSLDIGDLNSRIDEIQHWASNPPKDGPSVRNLIQVIGPTSCTIDLTAYIVTPLGAELTWETEEFLRRFDEIWDKVV